MFQGCEAFFVGNKPSNVGEYERRFLLRAGISSAAYASNRRTHVDPIRTKKKKVSRSLIPPSSSSPLWRLFAGRYFRNERSLLLTPESIKPIIEAKMAKKDRESTKESYSRATRAKQGPEAVKPGKVTKITDECTSALMSAVNFLEDIAMALSAEAPEFSLDYLGLHRTCWPLLEHVSEKCGPTLVEIFGPIPIEKYVFLGLLPVFIFSSATEGSIIGAPLQRTDEPSDQVLRLAAKAIEEFFKDGGDDRQAKALEQVHGQRVHVGHFVGEDVKNEAAKEDVPIAKDVPVAKKDVADAGKDMAWAQGSKVRSKILSAFE
ncbi:MAG: hypothetical protein Q9208_006317 [Pyrenodesmia sp. 3 TL-2023]